MAEVLDTIPHDGSDQIFEVTMRLHAFWCPDLRDWILCRPMNGERLPSGARHIGPLEILNHRTTAVSATAERSSQSTGTFTNGVNDNPRQKIR